MKRGSKKQDAIPGGIASCGCTCGDILTAVVIVAIMVAIVVPVPVAVVAHVARYVAADLMTHHGASDVSGRVDWRRNDYPGNARVDRISVGGPAHNDVKPDCGIGVSRRKRQHTQQSHYWKSNFL